MISIDAFWGTFGGLIVLIVLGAIAVRSQLTKHDQQIRQLQESNRERARRFEQDIAEVRSEARDRQQDIKQEIHSINQNIQRIYELLTTQK